MGGLGLEVPTARELPNNELDHEGVMDKASFFHDGFGLDTYISAEALVTGGVHHHHHHHHSQTEGLGRWGVFF